MQPCAACGREITRAQQMVATVFPGSTGVYYHSHERVRDCIPADMTYNRFRPCPKCLIGEADTRYHSGAGDIGRDDGCYLRDEHMHRVCRNCGYDWLERCAEATAPA